MSTHRLVNGYFALRAILDQPGLYLTFIPNPSQLLVEISLNIIQLYVMSNFVSH